MAHLSHMLLRLLARVIAMHTRETTSFNAFLIYYTSPSISFLPYTRPRHYLWQLSFLSPLSLSPPSLLPLPSLFSGFHVSEISSNWIDLSLTCISASLSSPAEREKCGGKRKINDNVCYFTENYVMLIAYRKEINQAKLNLCGSPYRSSELKCIKMYANLSKIYLVACARRKSWYRGEKLVLRDSSCVEAVEVWSKGLGNFWVVMKWGFEIVVKDIGDFNFEVNRIIRLSITMYLRRLRRFLVWRTEARGTYWERWEPGEHESMTEASKQDMKLNKKLKQN
jgi:hypothetical protein